MTPPSLRFLLLQTRDRADPMREHEVLSFARSLECERRQITVFDLLSGKPSTDLLRRCDMILLGGSGDYSVTGEGEWLERALDALREVHERAMPTLASCWGFQAMARAMGGRVIHDPDRAEVGTCQLRLTADGLCDPIFGPLGEEFAAICGHEDRVAELPPGTTLLASSKLVPNQAYRFDGLPIYCTQFHPELDRDGLFARLEAYPQYVERIAQVSYEEFLAHCLDTPDTRLLLPRFLAEVFGD